MQSSLFVYAIGFLAQGFFSARILIQWVLSERARHIVSPNLYWVCSLIGSILLFSYGWMRDDFSIILGQLISYYIYIWNLNIKGIWRKLPKLLAVALAALPVVAIATMVEEAGVFFDRFFRNEDVPLWLLIYGSAGQIIFTIRFIYQWYYSYRRHASLLPVGFWIISLVGSGIIVSYGIFRLDPVLILGQSVGFIAYTRNIIIGKKQKANV
ncbi:MAG: lipid-A-disaccharide synthase N-terminal domain-containing protein [Prevotella sp.]|jgi:lipid-A-disaccharide synthase-like uncharacterized protein